jgi:DNA replication and repair protein RecF
MRFIIFLFVRVPLILLIRKISVMKENSLLNRVSMKQIKVSRKRYIVDWNVVRKSNSSGIKRNITVYRIILALFPL